MRPIIILSLLTIIFLASCEKKNDPDSSINFFSVQDDIDLGAEMDDEIMNDPGSYPVLSKTDYPQAYQHLEMIRDELLQSDNLNYADRFPWTVRIIDDDQTLNAFCTPGGYMYFYTGLIKYLDNEAQFAGVMAHEMAHADRRHVTDRLTAMYGFSLLFNLILGKESTKMENLVKDLALGLGALQFSRKQEYEADEYAVKYTEDSHYNPKGISGFFIKLESGDASKTPEFLSTHPSPDNRLEAIDDAWQSLESPTGDDDVSSYQNFKDMLP